MHAFVSTHCVVLLRGEEKRFSARALRSNDGGQRCGLRSRHRARPEHNNRPAVVFPGSPITRSELIADLGLRLADERLGRHRGRMRPHVYFNLMEQHELMWAGAIAERLVN